MILLVGGLYSFIRLIEFSQYRDFISIIVVDSVFCITDWRGAISVIIITVAVAAIIPKHVNNIFIDIENISFDARAVT